MFFMAYLCRKLGNYSRKSFKIERRNLTKVSVNEKVAECFQKIFDISEQQAFSLLVKHKKLNNLDKISIVESFEVLNNFNISKSAVIDNPAVLLIRKNFLRNHGKILLECGFPRVTTDSLISYHTIVRKISIKKLKACELIPKYLNVYKELAKCFNKTIDPNTLEGMYEENDTILKIRLLVMQKYFEIKLNMNEKSFHKISKQYFQFLHRPMKDIEESFLIISEELNYSTEKILKYPFVLVVDPLNTRMILNDPNSFSGLNVKEQLQKFPIILKAKYSSILDINNILEEHQIPLSTLKKSSFIYNLKPDTVKERILQSKRNELFEIFSKNPRFLFLVKYKNRAEKRLMRLRSSNRKCVSLQGLTMSNVAFQNYFDSPNDVNNKYDILRLFDKMLPQLIFSESYKTLNEPMKEIKGILERHPYFSLVPIESIAQTLDWFKIRFSNEVIIQNIHLLFYSKDLIEMYYEEMNKIQHFHLNDRTNDVDENNFRLINVLSSFKIDCKNLTESQMLSIILYLIEKNHYFRGEGIWEKNNTMESNIQNILV